MRYHVYMRTRVTLDNDVADFLKEKARLLNKPFKQVVNETLRLGMSVSVREAPANQFRVVPISSGFVPGVDPLKLNQLNDQLEVEEFTGPNAG